MNDLASPLRRFAASFFLPLRAVGILKGHREARRWALAIAAITGLLLLAILILLLATTGDLLGLLWQKPEGAWQLLWWPMAVVLFAVLLVVGAATLPTVLTAPLADPLVAATEKAIGARGPEEGGLLKMAKETVDSVVKALLRVGLLLLGHALLLPLWLIPGPGHAAWTTLSLVWSLFWLAFEYLDLPANRFGYRFREVARMVGSNLPDALGFATAIYLILWIPILNAFFIPLAVVSATVLFAELRASGRIGPSRSQLALGMTDNPID